jgi:hypothetical protein
MHLRARRLLPAHRPRRRCARPPAARPPPADARHRPLPRRPQEQDDHESALDWRLDAELKAAEQRHKQAEAALRAELAAARADADKARAELERQAAAAGRLQAEATNWLEVLELKDREIQNLTAALGELSYESEAAERWAAVLVLGCGRAGLLCRAAAAGLLRPVPVRAAALR